MRRQNEGEAQPHGSLSESINGETMLMFAYDSAEVPYVRLAPENLPLVDGRCRSNGNGPIANFKKEFCLLGKCKDCEPTGVDYKRFPSCPSDCVDGTPLRGAEPRTIR